MSETARFDVCGHNHAELVAAAHPIAKRYFGDNPYTIEVDADAVMRMDGQIASWVGRATATRTELEETP